MTTLSSSGADRPAASPPRRVRQALSQILGVVGASEGREIARRGRSGHRELFLPNQAPDCVKTPFWERADFTSC